MREGSVMLETGEIYKAGWECRQYGGQWADNPYTDNSSEYWEWFRGYRDKQEQEFNDWCE